MGFRIIKNVKGDIIIFTPNFFLVFSKDKVPKKSELVRPVQDGTNSLSTTDVYMKKIRHWKLHKNSCTKILYKDLKQKKIRNGVKNKSRIS